MNTASKGIGLPALLFIIFLILKLTHVITWSWLWVAAPLWVPACAALALGILSFIIWVIRVVIGPGSSD